VRLVRRQVGGGQLTFEDCLGLLSEAHGSCATNRWLATTKLVENRTQQQLFVRLGISRTCSRKE
jgi:hypothetical protein